MDKTYLSRYWLVLVPDEVSSSGELYVHADRLEVVEGSLQCWSDKTVNAASGEVVPRTQPLLTTAFGPGQWRMFTAAEFVTGSPVVIEHWDYETC